MKQILGLSPDINHILRTLPMIALSDASVLISGETGTGKELIAQTLHEQSRRRDLEMVTINCAALPTEDVELDLFGKCDTDGTVTFRGRLLAAEGSTVFLDEVDALPLSVQAKVLRFLEAGECQLQGSHRLQVADVRILAATSADLPALVKVGQFRADLYYRLQVVPIDLPPLRERSEDIPVLLKYYLREYAGNNALVRFTKEAEHCLLTYSWPGNVRELQNFCQRMTLLHVGQLLQPESLPETIRPENGSSQHQFTLPAGGVDLARVELDLIEQALDMAAGNRSKAARLLGISRDTLLYRMQKYDLSP
ncbi:Two-component system regulatory protein [Methylophaga thiooxydans]|uniref:Two-component system regulatory protein n=1 Tax=Methylophaga thiooxydans TaxID=392484 RepID=A0A0A0BIH5_9GAMM|nr:sigma-54 dependent transcriptional regulator [Methylophaga thiooxydans]KGM07726.1 Two-component system regulatory protein [Methylophaga thiooxydans]